jgi:type I restriction enzyme, S subunit
MSELGKYQLPEGWAWATIPDLTGKAGVFIDGDWVESKDQDPDGDVRLIQLADVGDGFYRDKSNRFMTKAKADALGCTFLKDGDILIARMPDPLGRACLFPGDAKPSVTVVDVAIVRSGNGEFDHRWLACFVNAHPFRSAISGLQAGSTRKRISRGNLATIPLPVPPLPEQRRIVAEIEKQFTRLDAGVAALRRVQANVKHYRAAVLKAACEGRLVSAEAEWEATTLGEVSTVLAGYGFPERLQGHSTGDIAFFKVGDISEAWKRNEKVLTQAKHYISNSDLVELRAKLLPAGTVVFAKIGAAIALNRRAIIGSPSLVDNNVMGLLASKRIQPRYLFHFLCTQNLDDLARATTVPSIRKGDVEGIELRLPSLDEQARIVAEVERRLSVVEKLEAVVNANLQRATHLRQSILQKAFTGHLVRQDSSDESAETLLKRIIELPEEAKVAKKKTKSKDQKSMPTKPVTTLEELLQRLDSIGGAAAPDRLLAAAGLGEEIEKFFDLLREGRNNGELIVPIGTAGQIKRNTDEN